MIHRRRIARSIVLAVALAASLASLRFTPSAFAQDMGDMGKGMDRSGVLDIRNDEERRVFTALSAPAAARASRSSRALAASPTTSASRCGR